MDNKKISFKIKVLVPIIAIFIVSVLFITFINYRMLSSAIRKKTNANLELFTGSVLAQINHLDIILDSTKQTLNEKHIAIVKTVVHILEQAGGYMTSLELQQLAELLDTEEINIADIEGNLINSNIPEYIGDDYKTTETTLAYMALAEGIISELYEEPRASILPDLSLGDIIHFAGVTRSGGGFVQMGFNAAVIGRLQEEINIDKTIKETKIGDNGFGFVITAGIINAHPDNDLLDTDVRNLDWYKTVSQENGFAWIEIDNKKYYAGFKNVNDNTVVGLVPHADYYRELNRVLIETIRLLIFSIILMIVVAYFVIGKLLLPIKHLVHGLGKMAESNLDARIEGSYNDEFDEIKDAVNSMAEEINAHMQLISGIEYASKIQRSLLPPESVFKEVFADYSCIWKPKDIVGGDIYWLKKFNDGAVLCVCDCTGHGTPGALLTMLVVSALDAVVTPKNCKDTAQIIWELEKRLILELNVNTNTVERGLTINDGCDLAVLYIAKDGSVAISSGNTNVFVCDGVKAVRLRGQKIRVGDGSLKSKEEIEVVDISPNPKNSYCIASDGLFEQIGSEPGEEQLLPFGFGRLGKLLIKYYDNSQSELSEKIFLEFEEYRGKNKRRDDFQFISFKPKINERQEEE